MRIFVETLDFKFPIEVDSKQKVSKLRKKISLTDPTTNVVKFLFKEKELKGRTTLEENGVHENCTIFLELIGKGKPSRWRWLWRQRGRAPRGGGGPGLFTLPESWLWVLFFVGVLVAVVSYKEAVMTHLVRPMAPVRIPPVPVPVPNIIVPPSPPIPDDEKKEEDEEYVMCTLALQWPKSHVLLLDFVDEINIWLVPQDRSTLHGLWPDVKSKSTTTSLEFDCSMGNDDGLIEYASKHWPNLDPKSPGVELMVHNCKFWAAQWAKHGVDSGLTQEVYMKLALSLFDRVSLPLDKVLQEAIRSSGASSSSSSKHHASNSGKCEPQGILDDFLFPKKKYHKPEVQLNILNLEDTLSEDIVKPKVLCRTPLNKKKQIFHSVNFKVQVKVTKHSSGSALPLCTFLPFLLAEKQCDDAVLLP